MLLPTYALAHANAAMCHIASPARRSEGGKQGQPRLRHADAAMTFGQDDARALTLAGSPWVWTVMIVPAHSQPSRRHWP